MKTWAIARRDLLRMARNPLTLLGSVLLPIAYLVILGNSLQGPLHGLPLGVVLEDTGAKARALAASLQAVANGPGTIRLVAVGTPAQGMEELRRSQISGLLVVPPRFSEDAARGVRAPVGLFVDNSDAVAAGAIDGAVRGALASAGTPPVRLEEQIGPPEVRTEEIYPRVDYDASLVPGVVLMAIFMGTSIAGGFNLVLDRFLGVHESYLSTPVRRWNLAVGMLVSGTVITLVASALVLAIGLLVTGASVHGGLGGYATIFGVQVLSGLGLLGMIMALLGRTDQPRIVGLLTGFLNVILFFPSGALYPVASFPGWLRAFARVNPETHAIAALKSILFRQGAVAAAVPHLVYLAIFAAAMMAIAAVAMKRTL